jgi:hypothetical protein
MRGVLRLMGLRVPRRMMWIGDFVEESLLTWDVERCYYYLELMKLVLTL